MKLLGHRMTQIYFLAKKFFSMLKTCFWGVLNEIFQLLQLNLGFLWPKRSSANIAVLRVRAKFMRILSDSVKCG